MKHSASVLLLAGLMMMEPWYWARAEVLPAGAQEALLRGNWVRVLEVLEKTDVQDPDVPCRMVAAHACLACNRNNQALVLFLGLEKQDVQTWKSWAEALASSAPRSPIAQYLHGDALARVGDFKPAEASFTQALKDDPKLGVAWVARGTIRAIQGNHDGAYVDILKAIQEQPTLADAHASLGALEIMAENAEGALEAYNQALALDPASALAYNGRGCARYGMGKPDEAVLDFEMATTLCPALVMTEANYSFVLAQVVRQVDAKVPRKDRPGLTLVTRSQTLVVDIPGIETQGADRPDKWAPVLIGSAPYARFNIRHEGSMGSLQQAERGTTIIMPRDASTAAIQERLAPVFRALDQGQNVYVKVDQNIKTAGYFIGGKPGERLWAADVANSVSRHGRQSNPELKAFLNTHSEGTVVAHQMDLKEYRGVILASDRLSANDIAGLARQNRQTHFFVSAGDMDLPHDAIGSGHLTIEEVNVVVANLKTGTMNPLKAIEVHGRVQDPTTRGVFDIRDSTGRHVLEGTLGDLAGKALLSPQRDLATLTAPQLKEVVQQRGIRSVMQDLGRREQSLLGTINGIHQWTRKNEKVVGWDNRVAVWTEGAKIGVLAYRMDKLLHEGLGTFVAQGIVSATKSTLGDAADRTLPPTASGMLKTVAAGITRELAFDPLSFGLQGAQEFAKVNRLNREQLGNVLVRQAATAGLELREVRAIRQRVMELALTDRLQAGSMHLPTTKEPMALASQLTGLTFSSKQPWSQMPRLLDEVTQARHGPGPVALVSQDTVRAVGFERMLNNRGIDTVITPPVPLDRFKNIEPVLRPTEVVGLALDVNDQRRKIFPWWPDDHGGGGGAAVAGPMVRGDSISFPGRAGRMVTLPIPESFRAHDSTWSSFKAWTPKGDAGGVDTSQLEWVFVDKGDWPVTTIFSLAYESHEPK